MELELQSMRDISLDERQYREKVRAEEAMRAQSTEVVGVLTRAAVNATIRSKVPTPVKVGLGVVIAGTAFMVLGKIMNSN